MKFRKNRTRKTKKRSSTRRRLNRKSLAYPAGLLLTATGLILLFVFVLYECAHLDELADHVGQIVVATLSGMFLVIFGFALMVIGSPGIEADDSVPQNRDDARFSRS